jgi:hypothetical protein
MRYMMRFLPSGHQNTNRRVPLSIQWHLLRSLVFRETIRKL